MCKQMSLDLIIDCNCAVAGIRFTIIIRLLVLLGNIGIPLNTKTEVLKSCMTV
jgi:hypothetical protein